MLWRRFSERRQQTHENTHLRDPLAANRHRWMQFGTDARAPPGCHQRAEGLALVQYTVGRAGRDQDGQRTRRRKLE